MNTRLRFSFACVSLWLALSYVSYAQEMDCIVPGAQEKLTRAQERSAIENEIMELERDGCRGLVAGDPAYLDEVLKKIIGENGLLFADGGGIVVGGKAQRAMFAEVLGTGLEIEYEPTDAFVSQSEDMAWAYGMYRVKTPDGAEDVGSYVSVWEKVNGEWKNVAEMRNSNGPVKN